MRKIYSRSLGLLFIACLFASPLFSQEADHDQYKLLVEKNAGRLGITEADARDAVITKAYTDEARHVTYVYLQQAYQQIRVYNTFISAVFMDGSLQYSSGNFVKDIFGKAGSPSPSKTAATAVQAAASHLRLAVPTNLSVVADKFSAAKKITFTPANIARRDIDVTLYWTPSDDKQSVRLTWNVNIDEKGSDDWWNVRIDAQTGDYVQKDNWTVDEHSAANHPTSIAPLTAEDEKALMQSVTEEKSKQRRKNLSSQWLSPLAPPEVTSATYRVIPFPVESPIHGSFANVVNPWMMAGGGNNANTLGWHFDGTNSYTITRGNNVFAFLDRRANNVADVDRNWPDTSTTPIPSLTFVHNLNTAAQPFQNTENKKTAVDNLFYWNNLMHDVMYQYGLTEAAGNFQNDNMSRGGAGNDYVQANAQDSAGYNNANFSTPTDGTSGRMQMYTWSTAPGFTITSPEAIAGSYTARENSFTAPNKLIDVGPVTGQCVLYNDDAAGTVHNACATTAPANAASLAGKIVLIDATTCTFISKVKKAQTAGAIAVMEYYPTILGMGGTDATVIIPTVSITTATANAIIAQLNNGVPVTVTLSSGIYIDGDFDNGVICHEYGHGVSNRLTGGPYGASCLSNAEQAGEGWSDYLGLMMTTDWTTATITDGTKPRPVGTYAAGQTTTGAGIRRYPYSTNLSVDPLTYANMAASTEVHNIGEIWCSAVWDMTWNIIQQQGSITPNLYNSAGTGGNSIALNLVMMGMKLQPCSPGFLDGRNAILAADSILYGYAHKCAIWNAFARRGMGYSAIQGLSTSATDQTAAFDLPGGIQITKAMPVNVGASAQTTLVRTATCDCQAATYTLRDTIPAGFTYVSSSPLGTLNGNVLSFPATAFTAGQSQNFAIALRATGAACPIDYVLNDNRESATTGGFTSSGTSAWTTSTSRSHTPTSAWFAPNLPTVTSTSLTSAPTATTALKTLSILSFWHNFRTETGYDGGVVEYSTDGGTTWADAAPLFIRSGYNNAMLTGTALSGRRAFTGNSQDFQYSMLNLSSLGTAPVSFRFRMETDNGVGVEGWYVDDIVRANGCGNFLRSGIYDAANVRRDSAVVPIFAVAASSAPLPVTLLEFNANPLGSQVALNWKTAAEINVKDFTIEWSADGATWSTVGNTAAANRSTNSYGFVHNNPVKGNNYYRLQMNDVGGRFTYSPVRVVNMADKNHPMVVLAPNPVSTEAVLYISKDAKARQVNVYDATGSLVRRFAIGAGVQQLKISTALLSDGIYTVETDGTERYVSRMVVKH